MEKRLKLLEERVEYLEDERRHTLDILEVASTIGDFQTSISRMSEPSDILRVTAQRVRRLLPLAGLAFYLVEEDDSDFVMAYCDPKKEADTIAADVEHFISRNMFTWALKEKRPVFLTGKDKKNVYVLCVLATSSRVRGMFIGTMTTETSEVYDSSLGLLSVLMLHCANALESFELYRWVHTINDDLKRKVEALADSERELKKHRFHLEDLVEERTRELGEAVDKLKLALSEREVLIKEIHHRVKNNLQIISSLLSLQGRYVEDDRTHGYFTESQNRVRSLALIHETLYRSPDFAHLDVRTYLETLTRELYKAFCVSVEAVTLTLNVSDTPLELERAVPCGLIITELVSNCLKHAFPQGAKGEIKVNFGIEPPESLRLEVADNGVGLPEELDPNQSDTLGLRLVTVLTKQIKGLLDVSRDQGTTISVTFPLTRQNGSTLTPPLI